MSRQRELDVGLRQYLAPPMGRVVAEQHFEHTRRVVALPVPGDSGQSLFQVAAFGKGRFPVVLYADERDAVPALTYDAVFVQQQVPVHGTLSFLQLFPLGGLLFRRQVISVCQVVVVA